MQYGTQIGSLLTRAETQRLVVDLYKQGMPIKEIAAQVPVCLATVYRWINLPKHKNVKQKAEPKTEDSSAGGDSKKSVNTDNINSETALLEEKLLLSRIKKKIDFSQVCERSSQWCELRYSQVQTAH